MKKSLLYTRTGDRGMTSLVGGSRVAKNCVRVNAYGTVDELSAHLGLVRAYVESFAGAADEVDTLACAMKVMFSIGAHLATAGTEECQGVDGKDIEALEHAIDRLDSLVEPQRSFILPGGSVPAAQAHVARTVCRRAEREVLTLAATGESVAEVVTGYLNRLSDYLYVLARRLNQLAGVRDIPWLREKVD
ncbi:MAG: cob(I)yrinic acid a,c-diamide adenosyltransferase [Duncaniella sp.]|nr:cob(I)yrinic acid a,c-diamide adenosyltransferase [Duncaniella sp.]